MPLIDPIVAQDLLISVESATPSTFLPVQNMNSISKGKSRPVTTERVFGRAVPLRTEGTPDEAYTIAGFATLADPGQDFLNAAELARTIVNIKVQPDGTNGWTQKCYVHSYKFDSKPDGFHGIAYEFTATAPAVAVGTGWTAL